MSSSRLPSGGMLKRPNFQRLQGFGLETKVPFPGKSEYRVNSSSFVTQRGFLTVLPEPEKVKCQGRNCQLQRNDKTIQRINSQIYTCYINERIAREP